VANSSLAVVFEHVEEGWVQARIAEVPTVITVGRDRDEARSLVEDALREYIRAIAGDAPMGQVPGDVERVRLSLRPSD
jgi:predicted RNase H-like HicB family nuclease